MLATNGNFYGTTIGTVFKLTSGGKLTTTYTFCSQPGCSDGAYPNGLVQGADGNFYGTTSAYGAGTVFKVTPAGALTTLYHFCSAYGCPDGHYPIAGLIQGTDRNFYGTTQQGGIPVYSCGGLYVGCGTVFQITPAGKLTTLHSFCAESDCTDGALPETPLMQGTDGNFYGSPDAGGGSPTCIYTSGCGALLGLSVGLGPFVEASPNFGKVGRLVGILGNDLTGATGVTFNGTPAIFTVVSGTLIKATVPSGATSGTIEVTTPTGTLSSNVAFQVW